MAGSRDEVDDYNAKLFPHLVWAKGSSGPSSGAWMAPPDEPARPGSATGGTVLGGERFGQEGEAHPLLLQAEGRSVGPLDQVAIQR